MEQLVSLIERYRPGYSQTVEPASELDIEDMEDAAGPLPGAYLRFLKIMGRSIVQLQVHEADFNVQEIVLAYGVTPWLIKDQYLLIAFDKGLSGVGYYMDRKAPYAKDDCRVVTLPSGPGAPRDHADPIHAGLEEFLYVEAYRNVRLPLLKHADHLIHVSRNADANAVFDRICTALGNMGFARVPPVSRCGLFERGDMAVVVYRHPLNENLSLDIAADNPASLLQLVSVMTDLGGLERA